MFNKMKKNNKGFTLVELLVVIAIIGILAVVAVPSLLKNIDKAKVADVVADYSTIKSVVVSQYTDGTLVDDTYTKAETKTEFTATKTEAAGKIDVTDLSKEPSYQLVVGTSDGKTTATLKITAKNDSIASEVADKIGVDSTGISGKVVTVQLLK